MGEDFCEPTPRRADVISLADRREEKRLRQEGEERWNTLLEKYVGTFSEVQAAEDSDLFAGILKEVEEALKDATPEERLKFFSDLINRIDLDSLSSLELDIPIFQTAKVFSEEEISKIEEMIRSRKEELLYE